MKIAEKLTSLAPYQPTTAQFDVILDANESFVTPNAKLSQKITEALSKVALNRYPDPEAKDLCHAGAKYYGVLPSQIVAGNGSDELISILISSFLQRGDKLVTAEPDFSMYAFYAHLAEISVINCAKNNLIISPSDLVYKSKGAQMLIFSNPCNPTGIGLSREEVLSVVRACDCLVVVDEAYMEFFDQSVADEVGNFKNLLVLRTCSKALGLAAARCGFVLGNEMLIGHVMKAKSPFNVNAFTQAAALAILEDSAYIKESIEIILESKTKLYNGLKELGLDVLDTKTNFVLVKMDCADKIWQALRAQSISVRKIMGDYLRITAGSESENMRLLAVLKEVLSDEMC